MRISQRNSLIIDLEATCCDQGSVPREEMEIIEIGAVMMDSRSFVVVGEFQRFVRPVRHPVLTLFCRELTRIAQSEVDAAAGFSEVMAALGTWMAGYEDFLFCSWGDYDRKQFQQDCTYHQVEYPFGPHHTNLKAEFTRLTGARRQPGLSEALKKLGLTFDGQPHRGLDDARNIARIVRYLCHNG